ncbi:MAG: hypothetical protein K9N06_01150 [Candidatus Cloacimonetes bacterium]|nr:hypothetical protein [Candidatus Cloacimonadota bacterium]
MKKIILIIMVIMLTGTNLLAGPLRLKLGITDYNAKLKNLNFKSGIYRLHGRFDMLNLSSRLGLGTNLNLTYKSDNNQMDYINQYDFYLHNFDSKYDKKSYMMYGLLAGMRVTKLKIVNDAYVGKATFTFSRFFCGMLISRNYWGTELTASLNQDNDWKFEIATKYQYRDTYYLELAYSSQGVVRELDDEISLTFGIEIFKP